MRSRPRPLAVVVLLLGILAALLFLTLSPYEFRPSALFHLGERVASDGPLPKNFVVLEVPSYDGAMYFRIAERLPILLEPGQWNKLLGVSPGAYAYQRILLPVLGFALAGGNTDFFAWSFLLINVFCLLGSALLIYASFGRVLPALAIALCPSALLGLHFHTAEPLNIFLLTLLFVQYRRTSSQNFMSALLLCLIVLTREINLPLVILMALWFLWNRKWTNALWTVPALLVFIGWQAALLRIFGSVPFLVNQENMTFPFVAPLSILFGSIGFDRYSLSSIALFVGFVLPASVLALRKCSRVRTRLELVPTLLLGYLALMLVMPMHIWGSITSIGRAITPVYPLAVFEHADGKRWSTFLLASITLIGLVAGIGIALIAHPFVIQ